MITVSVYLNHTHCPDYKLSPCSIKAVYKVAIVVHRESISCRLGEEFSVKGECVGGGWIKGTGDEALHLKGLKMSSHQLLYHSVSCCFPDFHITGTIISPILGEDM